jgi:hypothetical protein
MPSLQEHLSAVLNRRVTWTDKKGVVRTGIIREVRRRYLVVEIDPYGLSSPRQTRLEFDEAELLDTAEPAPESHVTHSLLKESGYLWKWEIMIDGTLWRKRRGFRSHRTANASLQENLLEAIDVAENLHPSSQAIAASWLYRTDFEKSRLGPADFYDRLTAQKKQLCTSLVEALNAKR